MAGARHWSAAPHAYLLLLLLILSVKVRVVVYIRILVISRLLASRWRGGVVPHVGSRATKARARVTKLPSHSANLLSVQDCLVILCVLLKCNLWRYMLLLCHVLLMQSDSWHYGWRVLHAQVLLMLANH